MGYGPISSVLHGQPEGSALCEAVRLQSWEKRQGSKTPWFILIFYFFKKVAINLELVVPV